MAATTPASTQDFLDHVRDLLQQGELANASEQLVSFLTGRESVLRNEAIGLAARLLNVERQVRRGLLTPDAATVARSRLRQSALDFVDEIDRTLERSKRLAMHRVSFTPPEDNRLEKIIGGSSRLKSIAWLAQGVEASRAVCRVVTPNGLGSGFLIGENRVVTNHHVIADAEQAAQSHVEFNFEENAAGRVLAVEKYAIQAPSVRADAELDCCVFEAQESNDGPTLETWGALELDPEADTSKGDHVTIIQHPQGGPKQVALTANQVANVFDHRLQYTTDTLPGSSGSPVFNDDWKVIALHHAGGNMVANSRGDRMFLNEGILVRHLMDRLGL